MTNYGDSGNYTVAISTAESSGPSGNVAYLLCKSINGNETFDMGVEHLPGNVHFAAKGGKYVPTFSLKNCYILKYSTYDRTVSFNNVISFLRGLQDQNSNPSYIWAYSNIDSDYVKLGYLDGSDTDYLMGYIKRLSWELKGTMYYIKQLQWEGVNN